MMHYHEAIFSGHIHKQYDGLSSSFVLPPRGGGDLCDWKEQFSLLAACRPCVV